MAAARGVKLGASTVCDSATTNGTAQNYFEFLVIAKAVLVLVFLGQPRHPLYDKRRVILTKQCSVTGPKISSQAMGGLFYPKVNDPLRNGTLFVKG